jgi:hypothetical protein
VSGGQGFPSASHTVGRRSTLSVKKLRDLSAEDIEEKLDDFSEKEIAYLRDRGRLTPEQEARVGEDEGGDYDEMSKAELVEELEKRDLDSEGKKAELIARLEADDEGK